MTKAAPGRSESTKPPPILKPSASRASNPDYLLIERIDPDDSHKFGDQTLLTGAGFESGLDPEVEDDGFAILKAFTTGRDKFTMSEELRYLHVFVFILFALGRFFPLAGRAPLCCLCASLSLSRSAFRNSSFTRLSSLAARSPDRGTPFSLISFTMGARFVTGKTSETLTVSFFTTPLPSISR